MESTRLGVKQKVKLKSMVGGGLYGTDFVVWGPLRWSQTTTKVVAVVVTAAAQGRLSPCSCVWLVVGPTERITQFYKFLVPKAKVGGY